MASKKKSIRQHLAEVMGIVGYVQKDGKNSAQNYRYASAETVLKKVNSELSARGIAIGSAAKLEHFAVTPYEKNNKQYFRTDAVVKLTLTLTTDRDPSDELTLPECIIVEGLGQSTDTGDKAVMKANTAAIKYCLTNAFLISWGDDPEADAGGDPPKPENAPAKKTAAAKPSFKKDGKVKF